MADKMIRIILVEDHRMVRESLKQLFEEVKRINVVASCDNGIEALKLAKEHQPDIMLMDINMSPVDGFETTRMITKSLSSIKIIGISMNNQPYYAEKMLNAGALGYVTKSSPFSEIVYAIETVSRGTRYICEEVKKKMQ